MAILVEFNWYTVAVSAGRLNYRTHPKWLGFVRKSLKIVMSTGWL